MAKSVPWEGTCQTGRSGVRSGPVVGNNSLTAADFSGRVACHDARSVAVVRWTSCDPPRTTRPRRILHRTGPWPPRRSCRNGRAGRSPGDTRQNRRCDAADRRDVARTGPPAYGEDAGIQRPGARPAAARQGRTAADRRRVERYRGRGVRPLARALRTLRRRWCPRGGHSAGAAARRSAALRLHANAGQAHAGITATAWRAAV